MTDATKHGWVGKNGYVTVRVPLDAYELARTHRKALTDEINELRGTPGATVRYNTVLAHLVKIGAEALNMETDVPPF